MSIIFLWTGHTKIISSLIFVKTGKNREKISLNFHPSKFIVFWNMEVGFSYLRILFQKKIAVMLSRSIKYNNYECYLYCIYCGISLSAKNDKNHFLQPFSDFSPFRRYPRKIAFFTNKLCISDVYHIFLNRRDVKAYENQCFVSPSISTDMSNFRPWLID